jgi:hypothetical protein
MNLILEEVDKLTNSIENVFSGDRFDTEISIAISTEIKKSNWLFDWKSETKNSSRQVFKLTIKDNPKVIQGLMSLEVRQGHIFLHLIENAVLIGVKIKSMWESQAIYSRTPASLHLNMGLMDMCLL